VIAAALVLVPCAMGCATGSLAPALTFGATASRRDEVPAGGDPVALRAGAWMTWRTKTARGATGRAAGAGKNKGGASGRATDEGPETTIHAREPRCALAAACAWAAGAQARSLVLLGVADPYAVEVSR
jgi:hypothetical protein